MNNLKSLSKNYYLFFNFPLQILLLILLLVLKIEFIKFFLYFFLFYILIYWVGIQIGSHKLFSHKSWEPKYNLTRYFLAFISCYGLMGGPISWARMHRWHHRYSDTNEDPHTPKKGIITAYYKWLLDPPNVPPFVIKDYLKDSKLIFIEKHSKKIVLLTLILIFSVNYTIGLSFMLAMVLTFHSEMFINAFMHKDIKGKFTAINSVILAPFSGGSTLHKNHHDSPGSPNFSTKWYEIDATYYIILMLKK